MRVPERHSFFCHSARAHARCPHDESASGWRDIVNDAGRRGDLDDCGRAALMARIARTREEGRKVLVCKCAYFFTVLMVL